MTTDLSSEARRLLQEARSAFSPDDARLAALRARISSHIADGNGPSTDADGATSAANAPPATNAPPAHTALNGSSAATSSTLRVFSTWGTGHVVGAAVLAGALAAGGLAYWQNRLADRARSSTSSVLTTLVPAVATPTISAGAHAADEGAAVSAPGAELPQAAALPTSTTPPEIAPPVQGASASRPVSRGRSKDESEPNTSPISRGKPALTSTPTPVVAHPAPQVIGPAPTDLNDSLAEEIRLLRDARSALDHGDATQALAVLRQHQREFPRGTLYEERLASQVQALCLLGRVEAARGIAGELERAAPRSPHLARVHASCVGRPAPR